MLVRLLTFRSLRTRPLRALLSAFGIILGVAGILAIGITNRMALASVDRLFKDTSGNSNLIITSATSDSNGFRDKALRAARLPEVVSIVPSVHITTMLAGNAAPAGISFNLFGSSAGGGLTLYGIDPALDRSARPYKMERGDFLSKDLDTYEVVLVNSFAEANDIRLGSKISILTPNGVARLKVIGLMRKEGPGQLNNGMFGVIPLKTAQELFNRAGMLDQIDIVVDAGETSPAALESIKARLQAALGDGYSVLFPASQGKRQAQMLGSYQIGLNFLSGMALFVGAFLIYNAFSMTVVERTREFGLLRTVGMTRRQVTALVLAEALALGVIGSALGAGLGILLASGLSRLMEVMLGQPLGIIQIPTDTLVTSLVVGLVVTLISAALPAWQAGRISPLEALRVRGLAREGWFLRYGWILGLVVFVGSAGILILNPFPEDTQFRVGSMAIFALFLGGTLALPAMVGAAETLFRPLTRLLYGSSGRIGSSNVRRAKLRTTLTTAALMVGVAMILVVQGMTQSFKSDLVDWIGAYIGGDLYVASSVRMRTDIWQKLEQVDGVAAASPMRYFEVKWIPPGGKEETITFLAVDPVAHSRVTSFTFADQEIPVQAAVDRLARGEAVFISTVLSEKYGLQAGDTIRLKTRTGVHDFDIAAVVVEYYNQGLVLEGSWTDMRRFFRINDISTFLLKVEPGQSVDQVRQRIKDLYGERDHLSVESNIAIKERIFTLMEQAFVMFDVLAYIALIIGALGVVNTLMMNVIERTQEIGMLRGVGMTRGQVVKMILAEAAILGVIGGATGLVFGILLARLMLAAMMAMSGYALVFRMPAAGVAMAVTVALVISQLAALWPAQRAARTRILDAIHYE